MREKCRPAPPPPERIHNRPLKAGPAACTSPTKASASLPSGCRPSRASAPGFTCPRRSSGELPAFLGQPRQPWGELRAIQRLRSRRTSPPPCRALLVLPAGRSGGARCPHTGAWELGPAPRRPPCTPIPLPKTRLPRVEPTGRRTRFGAAATLLDAGDLSSTDPGRAPARPVAASMRPRMSVKPWVSKPKEKSGRKPVFPNPISRWIQKDIASTTSEPSSQIPRVEPLPSIGGHRTARSEAPPPSHQLLQAPTAVMVNRMLFLLRTRPVGSERRRHERRSAANADMSFVSGHLHAVTSE